MTFEEVLSHFTVESRSKHSAQCKCPAHDDQKASLTISETNDGRTLVFCHAKCDSAKVLTNAGLTFRDLFPSQYKGPNWKKYVCNTLAKDGKQVEAFYDYYSVDGEYAFTRIRAIPKDFSYGTLVNDYWEWGIRRNGLKIKREEIPAVFCPKSPLGLYNAIRNEDIIYYVEGEKDVLQLDSEGQTALTCGGAGDWDPKVAALLKNAIVTIVADNDKAGIEMARRVANDLTGIAKQTRVIIPTPEIEKGDVSDFFEAGHTVNELNELPCYDDAMLEARLRELDELEKSKQASEQRDPEATDELDKFHLFGKDGRVTGVFDYAIFQHLTAEHNIFILGGIPYIYECGCYHQDENGAKLKTLIRACCYPAFIKSTTIKRVYDLFITAAELQVSYSDLNQYPAHWINFKNGFYDPVAHQLIPHDPAYKAINQIPHNYNPNGSDIGVAVEEWLSFIVPDDEDREMLLGFAGYCLTRDTRQQKFMILNGEGGTGKSTVIRMIEAMVGSENTSNISLSELTQRFASFGLLGKLLNSCADLEVQALEDTSTLKKTLGEDTLRGEAKGHDAFSFKSYAKLIFSTNELPVVKAERTNGFYRRLLILPMNRVPSVRKADLFEKLHAEIGYFIWLCTDALERVYMRGELVESANSIEAVKRLRMDSDTVAAFLNDEVYKVRGARVERSLLYQKYEVYCYNSDRQKLTRNNFYRSMRIKGFADFKSGDHRFFEGISLEKTALQVALPDTIVETDEPSPFSGDH